MRARYSLSTGRNASESVSVKFEPRVKKGKTSEMESYLVEMVKVNIWSVDCHSDDL